MIGLIIRTGAAGFLSMLIIAVLNELFATEIQIDVAYGGILVFCMFITGAVKEES